ncbi:DNA alkylation repair protein [Candidatus Marinarcus aquaticus]|uniref:DNA alkylation repair protein n=1 Tax=Candidatus Marinarcus aquaticus TaxID=2044504 RepID=A0A4Q0XTQ7_9BACT|nr:DNA alkylation repair protein [Candidatus Marinarcus aquaticus]RXJ60752.1 DNA alkylation repair protein [Candidatus Marinarcus aquaticus]
MAEALKEVYTHQYIKNLASKVEEQYDAFNTEAFIHEIFNETWKDMELKMRMRHIAIILNEYLPLPYKEQLEVLKPASQHFVSFEAMFFQDFVELYGLDNFEDSMKALEVFTYESSSEFAIRQFILKYEEQTLHQMKLWAQNPCEHLRRLASEGCRPRLPWAIALNAFKKDPTKVLEIIELLKNDESTYVQKSVANNLNDISKDNPQVVIEFVKNNLGKHKNLDWICKHGSRTLLKQGDEQILKLFGYRQASHVKIKEFTHDEVVVNEGELNFKFTLQSIQSLGNLRVEYAIYYLKANQTHNKKMFMLSQNSIKVNEKTFEKKQSFKNMTTRKHYSGKHYIALYVNGEEMIKKEFELL